MYKLSRLCEDLQGSKPPIRSPLLPLVTLIHPGLGIPVSKALPKLLRVLLCLLDLDVEESGCTFERPDLEVLR